ncbi:MAG TPA: hypothetical protein VNK82_06930 [Terriglobales bacterium]|nr:hypothetical protein [Terriglobales bacterium]
MDQSTQTLLMLFVAATSIAVVIQMGILIGLFLSVKRTAARIDGLADEIQKRGLPLLDGATAILQEVRPNLASITSDLATATATLKEQAGRLDELAEDALDRTRLQVIRADQLVSRALDKVEETTDLMHETVISPVRQLAALVQGLGVGIDTFFGRSRRRGAPREAARDAQEEEMFI